MYKKNYSLILFIFVFLFPFIFYKYIYAAPPQPCGNGNCQASLSENCSSCSADCGICPTPTPTPTPPPPTPTPPPPTPTPPTSTPTLQPSQSPTITPVPSSGETSTPLPTSPTYTGTSNDSTSGETAYPSILLTTLESYFNNSKVFISGNSSTSQGSIASMKYSVDSGSNWINILANDGYFDSANENFSFLTNSLSDGSYLMDIIARNSLGNESSYKKTFYIITTPPEINLPESFDPTDNTKPLIQGTISSVPGSISNVQVSLDGGISWNNASYSNNKFSFRPFLNLEDGNYLIIIRVIDFAGNVSLSNPIDLIIDTIPPKIGGSTLKIGTEILKPENQDVYKAVTGKKITYAFNTKGGVTSGKLYFGSNEFPIQNVKGTDIWFSDILFEEKGTYKLNIYLEDGAGNTLETKTNTFLVEESGFVADEDNNLLSNVELSLFVYDENINNWTLWDGSSLNIENPTYSDNKGRYSFIVPKGKYYIKAKLKGFSSIESQIIDVSNTSILSYPIRLNSQKGIKIKLPLFNEVFLGLPSIFPNYVFLSNENKTMPNNLVSTFNLNDNFLEILSNMKYYSDTDINEYISSNKYNLISFIDSWSSGSLEQLPLLKDISQQNINNLNTIVYFVQESFIKTKLFINRGKYNLVFISDPLGEIFNKKDVVSLPQSILINSEGQILEVFYGIIDKEMIINKIESLN